MRILLSVSVLCLSISSIAYGHTLGPSNGGGGTEVESAFRLRANGLIDLIETVSAANSICSAKKLRETLKATNIVVADRLIYRGRSRADFDAFTSPLKIQLLKSSWSRFLNPQTEREEGHSIDQLILHEVLRSTGRSCPDDRFARSERIERELGTTAVDSITITDITGVSGVQRVAHSITALGTLGDRASCAHLDGIHTCNNCESQSQIGCNVINDINATSSNQSPLCSCQSAAIYSGLNAVITIKRYSPSHSRLYLLSGTQTPDTGGATAGFALSASSTDSLSVPWSSICGQLNASGTGNLLSADCTTVMGGTAVMTVWADNNGDGILDAGDATALVVFRLTKPSPDENIFSSPSNDGVGPFNAKTGDGRIYLTDLTVPADSGFPFMNTGLIATQVNVYLSPAGLNNAHPGDPSVIVRSISIKPDGSLAQPYVNDLINGTRYWMRIATVDQANNVMQFFPDQLENLPPDLRTACSTPPNYLGCPYTAVPSTKRE